MGKNKYKPMECPICGKFYFSDLQDGDEYSEFFCSVCGWVYDLNQAENPDCKDGENEMSLNEYKAWYENKIAKKLDYNYWDENKPAPAPHKCPICGKYEFEDDSSFDICPFCGWEDDGIMEDDPDYSGGANDLSLNEYKKQYEKNLAKDPNYKWAKR